MTSILVALFENKHLEEWAIQDEKALKKKDIVIDKLKKVMPLKKRVRLTNIVGFTGSSRVRQKPASRYFDLSKDVIQKRPLKSFTIIS